MWEDVGFAVAGTATQTTGAGGFVLEPDEAKQLLSRLKGVRDQLLTMQRRAARLCAMTAPSQDPGTMAAHEALVGDGGGKLGAFSYGGGHVDLQLAYVTELVDRISAALGMTESSDHHQAGLLGEIDPPGKTE
ncbi:hypothetical protein GCM10022222_84080 [Amycolatopsis ultiminotia]|uniref:PE family protein n=1 Tax=Amycolatopsis ultiminotia TaxID=543629 RepID=A0ABP6YMA2_9PSEU